MSKIQWTDKTANPIKIAGGGNYCEKISPGCANCYASGLNSKGSRFGGNGKVFGGVRPEARPDMQLNVDMLHSWANRRKPKKNFIGSMTDIFGEWVPDWMAYALFDAMYQAPTQTFQILTKRPERMAEITQAWLNSRPMLENRMPENIWLGVSAEDQIRYDERLPWLIRTPAEVKFLSLEPLLGPIYAPLLAEEVHWVIIGGESGPGARPMDLEWVRSILAQCKYYNIPAFLKQLGSHWAKQTGAHSKGGDPAEWPEWARVRAFPQIADVNSSEGT